MVVSAGTKKALQEVIEGVVSIIVKEIKLKFPDKKKFKIEGYMIDMDRLPTGSVDKSIDVLIHYFYENMATNNNPSYCSLVRKIKAGRKIETLIEEETIFIWNLLRFPKGYGDNTQFIMATDMKEVLL